MSSYEDKIWLDGDRKLDAICQDVLDASSAIRNAQDKIQSQIQREMQTHSPEEWFKYNLPPAQ